MNAVELFKQHLLETGNAEADVKNDKFVESCIKESIAFDYDDYDDNGDSRWWTNITCYKTLTINGRDYKFTLPYAKATGDNTVEDMGFVVDVLKELTVEEVIKPFKANHAGKVLHEILDISKVDEVKIMLDKEHPDHNRLILIQFLLSEDRAAISVAIMAISKQTLPTPMQASSVVEAIMNCPVGIINHLVNLFDIGDFFTSETAKAQIHMLIQSDEELISLRDIKVLNESEENKEKENK